MLGKIAWKVGNKCEHNLLFSCLWIFTAKVENTGKIGQNWCGNWETSRNNANNWAKTFFRFRKRTGALATYLLCPSHCSSPLQRNENCRLLSPRSDFTPNPCRHCFGNKAVGETSNVSPLVHCWLHSLAGYVALLHDYCISCLDVLSSFISEALACRQISPKAKSRHYFQSAKHELVARSTGFEVQPRQLHRESNRKLLCCN